MWFLKFWLICSIICIIVAYISCKALNAKLKREGYKINTTKYSFFERLHIFLYLIIPVFNILMIFAFIFGMDSIVEKLKREGTLVKSE